MTVLVIILVGALVILGIGAALWSKLMPGGNDDAPVVMADGCATCNGDNDKCEQECMMEAATKETEYYDDEELDRYRGRPSDGYTDDEAEEFRDILYTMQRDEATGWNRSLILRGINVPDQVKDELIMILGDNT